MYRFLSLCLLLALAVGMLTLSGVARGQTSYPLNYCLKGAFSTEEDFMSREIKPYDGNPYISDGDLLTPDGQVCARNADLLQVFNPTGAAIADLGLDAVDIVDFEKRLVGFSTELDDPLGKFTAGDLLFTDGGVVPNTALVAKFGIKHDIGLDGLQLIGKHDNLIGFINRVRQADPAAWDNGLLNELLDAFDVDIWFSIEGTYTARNVLILDGDLLAASGIIVARNSDLLPGSVPAGLPTRGLDFGLDAVNAPRLSTPDTVKDNLLFSTEILFRGEPSFTDGDVLRQGDGVVATNESLIQRFYPKADFLGLDALWIPSEPEPTTDPNLQELCGVMAADFDSNGLYRENYLSSPPGNPPRRPCGRFVPIDGDLPPTGVINYRVAYRAPSDAPGTAIGIRTNWTALKRWKLHPWYGWHCDDDGVLSSNANGWVNASQFLAAQTGDFPWCNNGEMQLAVWDTANVLGLGFGPSNPNGHYLVWLEWQDAGGSHTDAEYHIQLDNVYPEIAAFPNGLQVRLPGSGGSNGTAPVPICNLSDVAKSNILQVWGQFKDPYYWQFDLQLYGGNPPGYAYFGPHRYWDPNDGTPPIKNTDDTGTMPDATTVRLRDINMTALGDSFKPCCYMLVMHVYDASIRHGFNGREATDNSGSYYSSAFINFAAAPSP